MLEKRRADMAAELRERLRPPRADLHLDELLERQLGAVRRYKDEEVLRIAMHDIAGTIDLPAVSRAALRPGRGLPRGLPGAGRGARPAPEGPCPTGRLCVIGMGKLGGRELGYHSDLDLIFLYPGRGDGRCTSATPRLAQRLPLVPADAAARGAPLQNRHPAAPLRQPGGAGHRGGGLHPVPPGRGAAGGEARGGPGGPVRSQLWERQALLRARFVAGRRGPLRGAAPPGHRPGGLRRPAATAPPWPRRSGACGSGWRASSRKEADRGQNPKTGHGGLVDVEFAAQFLQLAHGHDHPSIRTGSTPEALARLRAAGLLASGTTRRSPAATSFLRRVELRLRIVHDYAVDHLPPPGARARPARAPARLRRPGGGGAVPRRVPTG